MANQSPLDVYLGNDWTRHKADFWRAMADHVSQADAGQVVLVMVGLPARGKSLISGKGMRF